MSVWLCERIATPIISIEALKQVNRAGLGFSLMTRIHPGGTSRRQQRMWGTEAHSAPPCVRQAVVPTPPKGGTLGTQASQKNVRALQLTRGPRATYTHAKTRGCHAECGEVQSCTLPCEVHPVDVVEEHVLQRLWWRQRYCTQPCLEPRRAAHVMAAAFPHTSSA